jgi:hypothetical protein
MIFSFSRHLTLIVNPDLVPSGTAEVLQFGKTVAEDTGMSGYQNSKATSAYRFSPTSVWQFRDITIVAQACNRCYELDMVILKVGLLRKPPVLCTSGKIYQLSSFHFKILHYIYTPLYIQEKQVELHPLSLRTLLRLRS